MKQYSNGRIILIGMGVLIALGYLVMVLHLVFQELMAPSPQLLTDPFLQVPTETSVEVVWFTEFPGSRHAIEYGETLDRTVEASTTTLNRLREDSQSRVGAQTEDGQVYTQPTPRLVYRHAATVTNLTPGERIPYRVISIRDDGQVARSDAFTLTAMPPANSALNVLLTSDHQLMPMTPAGMQKVAETVGQVDAIFFAGDLVNIPDRASEWFDDNRGGAFFPALQGRAEAPITHGETTTVYRGGALLQYAPLFPAIGNHEVMGRFSTEAPLKDQFNDPVPRRVAAEWYDQQAAEVNPNQDPAVREAWLDDHSFNIETYQSLFSVPQSESGGSKYYAVTVGDVRLISLYVTNIWRSPKLDPNTRGRYRESDEHLNDPTRWGYGQHIFEAISPGSPQYEWLRAELQRPEFTQAKYKIVIFHHPPHSLGDNIVPAYTNPVQLIDYLPNGEPKTVRYEYPKGNDFLIKDVIPLLEQAGVQLVFYGHSHVWNRFVSPGGMHFLESSNVGNTYGAYIGKERRAIPIGFDEDYVALGDPNGLTPVMPTLAPVTNDDGQPQPFIASNDITAFSIFNTETGIVSSYRFDTREPDSAVVLFDEFSLLPSAPAQLTAASGAIATEH